MTMRSFLKKNKIFDFIAKYDMIRRGDSIVTGLSGGPDSVCLLLLLSEIREEFDLNLYAVHVHHGIRKDTADRDLQFSKELCEKLNVNFEAEYVDALQLAKSLGISVEEAARNARYEILRNKAKQISGKIAVAHNADDNAETVLFHMARGCGLKGLCGIAPVNGEVIRPLLGVKKSEIKKFLDDIGQQYCIDETNSDNNYTRNKIRNEISPLLEEVNSKATEHIFSMCQNLLEISDYFDSVVEEILDAKGILEIDKITDLPAFLQKLVIKEYLSSYMPMKKDVSQYHIDAVSSLIGSTEEKYVNLPFGYRARINSNAILVEDLSMDVGADLAKSLDEKRLKVRVFDRTTEDITFPVSTYTKWVDYDKIKGNLALRGRQPGDYMSIAGGHTKKVSDIFIDAKVPKSDRDEVPLVCDDEHVIWAVGYKLSEDVKLTDTTVKIIEISYLED